MQTQYRTESGYRTTGGDRRTGLAARASEAKLLLHEAWTAAPALARPLLLVAALAALTAGVLGAVPAASAVAVAATIPAVLVDLHVRRLPDVLVGGAALLGCLVLSVAAIADRPPPLGGIALGAVAMGAPMLLLHLVSPMAMGFGDVKLGLVLGGALGAIHWQLALGGLALAAGLTAIVALLRRRDTIAFGPGLLAGALLALAGQSLLAPGDAGADRRDTVAAAAAAAGPARAPDDTSGGAADR